MTASVNLHESWLEQIGEEFEKTYFKALKDYLLSEKASGRQIYPKGSQIFAALNATPRNKVKAVILGQDPYHGAGQANGLCFSVNRGMPLPPSLKNIYKELRDDLGIPPAAHGDLTPWAESGLLMLNSVLTVRAGEAASHQNIGWERFTDSVIKNLNSHGEPLVFILWGNFAKTKKSMIDPARHLILEAAHPSPFSAYQGFFGCKHFSKTNTFLTQNKIEAINWQI